MQKSSQHYSQNVANKWNYSNVMIFDIFAIQLSNTHRQCSKTSEQEEKKREREKLWVPNGFCLLFLLYFLQVLLGN